MSLQGRILQLNTYVFSTIWNRAWVINTKEKAFKDLLKETSTYLQFIKGDEILEKVAKRKTEEGLNRINLEERIQTFKIKQILEALGERRPPWLRQIITPIFSNVIMLNLGGERLNRKVLDHYLHHDLGMLPLLWCFICSFTHHRIPRSPPNFNQFFIVLHRTPPQNFIPIRS